MELRAIYYFPSERRFWMASGDALADARALDQRIDAILVTNPETLDPRLLDTLVRESTVFG